MLKKKKLEQAHWNCEQSGCNRQLTLNTSLHLALMNSSVAKLEPYSGWVDELWLLPVFFACCVDRAILAVVTPSPPSLLLLPGWPSLVSVHWGAIGYVTLAHDKVF